MNRRFLLAQQATGIVMSFVLLVSVFVLASGRAGAAESARLVALKKIWDQASHNAFTDLVRYQDRWFCTFREGEGHASFDGRLRILHSADGVTWESAALLSLTPRDFAAMKPAVTPDGSPIDLRDPHLCITPDGRLMLNSAVAYHGRRDMQSLAWFSQDGTTWGQPVLIAEHQFWLWRPTWHQGVAYGVGRIPSQRIPRLYRSHDGRHFDMVVKDGEFFPDGPGGSEATLRFLADDTALCLLRMTKMPGGKTGNAQLGIARPPYTRWEWKDLGAQIGGPNMIPLPDGRFVAAVRRYDRQVRTALCWLDPQAGTLTEFLTLPSGGDTSYAGLVPHDGLLWVSYYSSHEEKTSIYLAKVQIPETGADR